MLGNVYCKKMVVAYKNWAFFFFYKMIVARCVRYFWKMVAARWLWPFLKILRLFDWNIMAVLSSFVTKHLYFPIATSERSVVDVSDTKYMFKTQDRFIL